MLFEHESELKCRESLFRKRASAGERMGVSDTRQIPRAPREKEEKEESEPQGGYAKDHRSEDLLDCDCPFGHQLVELVRHAQACEDGRSIRTRRGHERPWHDRCA